MHMRLGRRKTFDVTSSDCCFRVRIKHAQKLLQYSYHPRAEPEGFGVGEEFVATPALFPGGLL